MSLPVVEIAVAPASEGLRADPRDVTNIKAPGDILKSTDGVIRIYYGLEHEDKASAYAVIAWESLAHHQNLIKNPEVYSAFGSSIKSLFDPSGLKIYHIATTSEPYKALDAPVTEFATFTLHDGQSKEALETLVDNLAKAINAAPHSAGASWGPVIEKDNVLAAVIGWTSVDAHWDLVKTDPPIIKLINECRAISTIALTHAPLAAY